MNRLLRATLAATLALAATAALGASRYVTDELRISVRTGTSEQYRIIEVLGSGTELELLEEAGEWARVRTPAGRTGWVRAQYLTDERVAADVLADVRDELADARERIGELEGQLADARRAASRARDRVAALSEDKSSLEERLARADEGLRLKEENERLQGRVERLEGRVTSLQEEAARLSRRSRKEWFVIGAGVLFGGMLFGIIVTRIPWRRRRDRMF